MTPPKRVLCIMDLAAVGRSSLAAVLPVLSACGLQACPLPASLFSTHTGGFEGVQTLDTADFCSAALDQYEEAGLTFDALYIGYLRGEGQIKAAQKALARFPDAYKLVDPAVGDNGKAYSGIDEATLAGMRGLCGAADLLTPNFTELALLCGEDPDAPLAEELLRSRASQLAHRGASILVTSVPAARIRVNAESSMAIAGGVIGGESFTLTTHHLPQSYPGTGDLFAAAVLGLTLNGLPLREATGQAAAFVGASVRSAYENNGEPRHGPWFEQWLLTLAQAAKVGEDAQADE